MIFDARASKAVNDPDREQRLVLREHRPESLL